MSSKPYVKREDVSFSLIEVDLQNSDDDRLLRISNDLAVGLSLEEMKVLKTHFEKLGRSPTDVELQTFGQTWSEHCFHKTFKGNVVSPDGKTIARSLSEPILQDQ